MTVRKAAYFRLAERESPVTSRRSTIYWRSRMWSARRRPISPRARDQPQRI
jgi:hypothetical protein